MIAILDFLYLILDFALNALVWVVIADVLISWLTAFDILNLRNPAARQVVVVLDRITRPLLWPFRRIIPPIGGLDLTPMLLVLVVMAARQTLLPALFNWLRELAGAGVMV